MPVYLPVFTIERILKQLRNEHFFISRSLFSPFLYLPLFALRSISLRVSADCEENLMQQVTHLHHTSTKGTIDPVVTKDIRNCILPFIQITELETSLNRHEPTSDHRTPPIAAVATTLVAASSLYSRLSPSQSPLICFPPPSRPAVRNLNAPGAISDTHYFRRKTPRITVVPSLPGDPSPTVTSSNR